MVARLVVRTIAGIAIALVLHAQPKRIVSTFPSITEALFAIGAGDRVVGVSNFCVYPPAVLSLPKVGTFLKPDAEKIAQLRPNMVIIRKSTATLSDLLLALGISHVEVPIGSLADVYAMIREIGVAVGATERADRLNEQIRSQLHTIRSEKRDGTRPKVLIIVGRTPGMLTNLVAAGPPTYLGELLDVAGGKNVLTGSAIPYPRISLETVLSADPEVILDLSMTNQGTAFIQPWLDRRELQAVRNGRIFAISPEPLATPGPRVAESAELICTTIHRPGNP